MKIRLLEGRTFEPQDENPNAMPVVIVNQALAKRFWTASPIGRRVNPGFADPKVWCTIVGVVEDTKNAGMDKPAGPELYFQARQVATRFPPTNVSFVARASNSSTPLESSIRNAVRELDPTLPVYNLRSMEEVVSKSVVQPRFLALLLATFSGIALFLAAIGIYGVMAYSVTQRTQEIGVRMALGARPLHVLRLVFKQGLGMLVIGTLIGLAGAFALTRLMRTLLFEVTATDPLTYVSVIGLLILVALLACYIPARRAAKVDPLVALRYE
jgi:putative ABC transport system permease protein